MSSSPLAKCDQQIVSDLAHAATRPPSGEDTSPAALEQQHKQGHHTRHIDTAKNLYWPWYQTVAHLLVYTFRGPLIAAILAVSIEPYYQRLIAHLNLPDVWVFVAGSWLVYVGTYAVVNGFFSFCDYFGYLRQYRLPRTKRMMPKWELIKATLSYTAFSSAFIAPIALYLLHQYVLKRPTQTTPLPSFFMVWMHLTAAALTNELGAYVSHRSLHEVPFLYKYVHKKHHQYIGTIAVGAEHAHFVERMTSSFIPTFAYCISMGMPNVILWTFLSWRLEEAFEAHSGYCFKDTWLSKIGLLNSHRAEFHDFHHTVNMGNYGLYDGFDRVLGTMDHYLIAKAKCNGGLIKVE